VPVNIAIDNSDDFGFIETLNAVVSGVVATHVPQHVWIVRIDNWFDHKWLKFSGHGAVASNIPIDRWDTVKATFYRDKITLPPFNPNRVISQCSYLRSGNGYSEVPLPYLPHSTERQHSNENLHRQVQNLTDSAAFIWFSGNTVANGRGSVMVYNVTGDSVECWFAAFKREQCSWKLAGTKGVSRTYVESLVG
jgi:hypothetical protein